MITVSEKKIFIVHGRDKLPALELARMIEKRYSIDTILLEEKAHKGRTLIEKLEAHSDVDFAAVILTPDDVGALEGKKLSERARQNVLFELGKFIGKIGRERVCMLIKGDIEIPSDLSGIGYFRFRESIRECFYDFENELIMAGLVSIPTEMSTIEREEIIHMPESLYLDFALGMRIGRVPWNEFDTVEVQGVLYQYFINLGYNVDWVHIAKTSHRKSEWDLLCEKDGRTIGIIVVTIPDSKDFQKLKRLYQKDYDRKIYVYVNPLSVSFKEQMGKYSNTIEMLSINEFEQEILDTEIGTQLLCCVYYSNSEFVRLARVFLAEIMHLTKNYRIKNLNKVSKPMPELWQLKDYSFTMKKSMETLLYVLEEPIFYAETGTENLLHIFKQAMGTLTYNMSGFYQTWKKILNNNRRLIQTTHHKFGNRSNWLGLWTSAHYMHRSSLYSPGLLSSNLDSLRPIDKDAFEKGEAKFAAMVKKETGRNYVPTPFFAEFVREGFLRPHFSFALSLESLVDQMFEL